ncbi:uncharacterized protein LOC134722786 [Mytilus trossulus]|uniref:uncharacterized protein LOC134722786 n=1 Tax=Mytilus trossulus TaxID=6551 RepID=UPI003005014D
MVERNISRMKPGLMVVSLAVSVMMPRLVNTNVKKNVPNGIFLTFVTGTQHQRENVVVNQNVHYLMLSPVTQTFRCFSSHKQLSIIEYCLSKNITGPFSLLSSLQQGSPLSL